MLQCDQCTASFEHVKGLKEHAACHTTERPFPCRVDRCSSKFKRRNARSRHEKGHQQKPYRCTVCAESFSRKDTLQRHENIHEAKQQHSCTEPGCDKVFLRRSALEDHVSVHTRDKHHCCTVLGCSEAFRSAGDLAHHRDTHKGIQRHKCTMCSSAFSKPSKLLQHMLVHTKERPFKCHQPGCSSTFSQKHTVAEHWEACHSPGASVRRRKEEERIEKVLLAANIPYKKNVSIYLRATNSRREVDFVIDHDNGRFYLEIGKT